MPASASPSLSRFLPADASAAKAWRGRPPHLTCRRPGLGFGLRFGLLLAWLGLALPTLAAGLTAVLERETVALGDAAILRVSVEGGSAEAPRFPDVPGLQIRQASSQRQFSFVNGAQSSSLELIYSITAERVGTFTIGPFTANAGGRRVSSEPVRLRVVAANDPAAARNDGLDRAAFLLLSVPRPEVYVGEAFVAETHLYAVGGQLRQAPQFQADGFTLGKLQNLNPESNLRTNDRIYSRIRFLQPLTAAKSGDLKLQASGCVLDIPLPNQRRQGGFSDFFDEVFAGREARRFNLATEPFALKVLPLPTAGQPTGFNGAVGDFRVTLTAAPTNLQAGDPITVRVDIAGRGNFDAVQLPEQPAWKGFRSYPANGTFEPQDSTGFTGVKHFEQVLTPESADLTELPSFEFAFFNPDKRTYQVARTRPVPLKVSPGATTPHIPAPANANAGETARQPELVPLKPHLGFPVAVAMPWVAQPWFLVGAALPPLAWIGARFWRRHHDRRSGDAARRQRELLRRRVAEGLRALTTQAQQGDAATFYATLFRVLQDAVAARIGQPPASITEGTLDAHLPGLGVGEDVVQALHQLFQACNQARYARQSTPGDLAALAQAATEATRAIATPAA